MNDNPSDPKRVEDETPAEGRTASNLEPKDPRTDLDERLGPAAEEERDRGAVEEVIPIVEEEVHVGKRRVTTGRVRVRTLVEEVEEIARATLDEEIVEVEHVPVNRPIDAAPAIRTEGDVTIVPVVEEVLVLEKRLVLKEELHIRRRRETETVAIPVTLRKQRAVVERLPGDETAESGDESR